MLLGSCGRRGRALNKHPEVEHRIGADQRDEVRSVDRSPAILAGLALEHLVEHLPRSLPTDLSQP